MDQAYHSRLMGVTESDIGNNTSPTPKKDRARELFEKLLKRMYAVRIEGWYAKKKMVFTTLMGATVEAVTSYRGEEGIWAKITSKLGVVTMRTLLPGFYLEEKKRVGFVFASEKLYCGAVAAMVKKHELLESGWTDRRELEYGKCNHHDHERHHNCGCTEVTTIRKRK